MLANALKVETTSTTSPYTATSVTGFASLTAVVQDVLVPYEIESGADKEWGWGKKDGSGNFAVATITATLKGGVYANTGALTPISKSGVSTIRLTASADTVFSAEPSIHSGAASGVLSPHICRNGSTVGTQTLRYGVEHYEVTRARIYTEAAIEITGAATAGATMRMGIYAPGSNTEPGPLLAQSDAAELIDASGTVVFTLDSPIWLPRGDIRIASISTASATVRAGVSSRIGPTPFGSASPGTTNNFLRSGTEAAMPSSMPDPFSSTALMLQTGAPTAWALQ